MKKAERAKQVNDLKQVVANRAEKARYVLLDAGGYVSETVRLAVNIAKNKKNKKKENIKAKPAANKEASANDKAKENKPKVKFDEELKQAVTEYNNAYAIMEDSGAGLYVLRTRAVDLIDNISILVNSIANRPKSFDTDIAEIQTQRAVFTDACEFAKAELEAAQKSALGAGAGLAAGAAIVSVAPTAAIWVATTFGAASTGTAISALSGAAATNAALAWLGGGVLAAGGGGMAAGQAFLALAGPIGWTVAGATLLTSITLFSVNKFKISEQKKNEIQSIRQNIQLVRMRADKIRQLIDETAVLRDKLNDLYSKCLPDFNKDFMGISMERQMQLGALVNNTKALAALLGKTVE